MSIVVLTLTGAIGALARYILSGWAQGRSDGGFPAGTAFVNLLGALALGLLAGSSPHLAGWSLAGVGFTGGFTTFSTWMVESARLGPAGAPTSGSVVNLLGLASLGVLLAATGYALAG